MHWLFHFLALISLVACAALAMVILLFALQKRPLKTPVLALASIAIFHLVVSVVEVTFLNWCFGHDESITLAFWYAFNLFRGLQHLAMIAVFALMIALAVFAVQKRPLKQLWFGLAAAVPACIVFSILPNWQTFFFHNDRGSVLQMLGWFLLAATALQMFALITFVVQKRPLKPLIFLLAATAVLLIFVI